MLLKKIIVVWLLVLAGFVAAAQEPAACSSHVAPYTVDFGVVQMNLGRTDDWQQRIDSMIAKGVKSVRLNYRPGVHEAEPSIDTIEYATKRGMAVLLAVPLHDSTYYSRRDAVREEKGEISRQFKLSAIDLDIFTERFKYLITQLDERGVAIPLFEIGNEFNWAGFNGDLPVRERGTAATSLLDIERPHGPIFKGFAQYKEVLLITRSVLATSTHSKSAKVLSAGLVSAGSAEPFAGWFVRSGGTALSIEAMNQIYDELGITELVDGRAIHIYPRFDMDMPAGERFLKIRSLVGKLADMCSPNGEACYVTEWGFNATYSSCSEKDPREPVFRDFLSALSCEPVFKAAWVFTWERVDDGRKDTKSVYRCGTVAPFGGLLHRSK